MLTKKAYALEEVFLYLEALEMLDMVYTLERLPDKDMWVIRYEPSKHPNESKPIQYED